MRGGTYAEAVKAGFNEEAAGFMGRFGAELQSEVIEEIAKRQVAADSRKHAARMERVKCIAGRIFPVVVGVVGIVIGRHF